MIFVIKRVCVPEFAFCRNKMILISSILHTYYNMKKKLSLNYKCTLTSIIFVFYNIHLVIVATKAQNQSTVNHLQAFQIDSLLLKCF